MALLGGTVRLAANLAIVTATSTVVTWDTEEEDVGNCIDIAGASDRITFPYAGLWHVTAFCQWEANATGAREAAVAFYNAAAVQQTPIVRQNATAVAATDKTFNACSLVYRATVGDYCRLIVLHRRGANNNLEALTRMSAWRVGL